MAGVITALVVQKKNKQRVNVFIDGEFAFGIAMIEAFKLHKGDQLSETDIEQLKALDEIEVAHEYALNFLSYRPRSVAEVRKRMAERKYSEQTIEQVIERLIAAGLLDDLSFARFWVANREQSAPRGKRALQYELRQKGVAKTAISEAITEIDEDDAAYRAALPVARRNARLDERMFIKRVGDFLMRRGFDYSTVRDVAKQLWHEVGDQDTGATDDVDIELGD